MTPTEAQVWSALAALAVFLWHHLATARINRIATHAKEVALVAFRYAKVAMASAGPEFNPAHFMDAALEKARAMSVRVGWMWAGRLVGMVEHELDVLMSELATAHADEGAKQAADEAATAEQLQMMQHAYDEGVAAGKRAAQDTSTQTGADASASTAPAPGTPPEPPAPPAPVLPTIPVPAATPQKETTS